MDTAKNRVYHKLLQRCRLNEAITTSELAKSLDLSRSVVSHYLNLLLKEQKVTKLKGRPVKWKICATFNGELFSDFIGNNGSMKKIIMQAKSAVVYPPNGLNMLITGHSGVGKSYLANKIYKYAESKGVIRHNAPYIVFNCADYADNPELISSALFGYAKGAFTGAEKNKDGLIKKADGGFLFLDEVHRLSSESQEKLFSFIDTNTFYKVGSNGYAEKANVRLLMATTENPGKVLLPTFLRRIPVKINLPDYIDRPVDERLELLKLLFYKEAKKINKKIKVTKEVVSTLLQIEHSGNIGYVKNIIQLACASAYNEESTTTSDIINVSLSNLLINKLPSYKNYSFILIDPKRKLQSQTSDGPSKEIINLIKIVNHLARNYSIQNLSICQSKILKLGNAIKQSEFNVGLHLHHKLIFSRIVKKQFGLKEAGAIEPIMFKLYQVHFKLTKQVVNELMPLLSKNISRSLHISEIFYRKISLLDKDSQKSLIIVFAILLSQFVEENIKLRGLIIAHGENTATSIQTVVNSLCDNYIFDAIDMPIDADVNTIIRETNKLINSFNTVNGFVLMVDMGSLEQLYTKISSHLDGDLLIINNLTTLTALDVAIKIKQNTPFKKIAEKADKEYTIEAKYYQGFSQLPNILISCISGLGIAEKISEILRPNIPLNIKIIPIGYESLKEKIISKEWSYFDRTVLVLTTIDITYPVKFQHMNLYDLLSTNGEKELAEYLSPYLSAEQLSNFINQIVRFFSKEGIAERLNFLNPDLVLNEVETIISKYELFYKKSFDGKFKLNLYMHIALMIERLMLRHAPDTVEKSVSKKEEKFFNVTSSIFQPIELKYNIKITISEMTILYELFKQFI